MILAGKTEVVLSEHSIKEVKACEMTFPTPSGVLTRSGIGWSGIAGRAPPGVAVRPLAAIRLRRPRRRGWDLRPADRG